MEDRIGRGSLDVVQVATLIPRMQPSLVGTSVVAAVVSIGVVGGVQMIEPTVVIHQASVAAAAPIRVAWIAIDGSLVVGVCGNRGRA